MDNPFFTDDFLKEEVRCEYSVTIKQKKIWAIELDLLSKLLEVCNKYNIKVFAFGGTLLGAVRHKGFIPWDDDVDVCLLKDDFEKLLSVAEKEFDEPYFFQTAFSDKRFHIGYARLRNSNTTGFIPYNDDINYNNGIFIDIFIMNGYTNNKLKLKSQRFKLSLLEKLIHSYYVDLGSKKGIKKVAMMLVKKFDNLFLNYDKLTRKYYNTLTKYDSDSERVTLLTGSDYFMTRYWCMKDDFSEVVMLPFESLSIPAPRNYDRILSNSYGDYMEFPPVEKRGKWHENVIFFDPDVSYVDYVKRLHGES